jgi:hypothetical protein
VDIDGVVIDGDSRAESVAVDGCTGPRRVGCSPERTTPV